MAIFARADGSSIDTGKSNGLPSKYNQRDFIEVQEPCPFPKGKPVIEWWDKYKEVDGVEYVIEPPPITLTDEEGNEYDNPAFIERGVWEEVVDIDVLKETLRTEKKNRLRADITIDGQTFDADDAAETAYLKYFVALSVNPSFVVEDWKASNGDYVTMDATLFTKIMGAVEARDRALFAWYKDEMDKLKGK